jgi:CHAT domain-containing protein
MSVLVFRDMPLSVLDLHKVSRWVCMLALTATVGYISSSPCASAQPTASQTKVSAGDLAEADRLYQQSAKLWEVGQYTEAQPLAERTLVIYEKALGPEHLEVAKSLNLLGELYRNLGNYARAEPLHKRALAIREKALGLEDPEVAKSLNSLGILYQAQGDYVGAEPLLKRALVIRENSSGLQHPDVGKSLNNLANLYQDRGNYIEAELLYKRSLAIFEKALGAEHPAVAQSLNNLANLRSKQGDYTGAEPLLKRALAIRENVLGAEHPAVAETLNNLAILETEQGDYSGAEPLYKRSLAILEKNLGSEHPLVASSLINLATLYTYKGDSTAAEKLFIRSIAINEKALGSEHPDVGTSLSGIGYIYTSMGHYAEAEPLLKRALTILEKALGAEHPDVASSLQELAILHIGQGEVSAAGQLFARALDIQEHNLALNLTTGSEAQKRDFLTALADSTDIAIWMQLAYPKVQKSTTRLALTTLLRRKGRVLDELTTNLALSRGRLAPEGQTLLDTLSQTRTQLAALTFSKPGTDNPAKFKAEWQRLENRTKQLENQLSELSSQLRAQARPITLDAVQRQLPVNSVLVELVRYRPFKLLAQRKADRFDAPHYAAYLLPPTGQPIGLDLGSAAHIDILVKKHLDLVRDSQSSVAERRTASQTLYSALWQPLERKFPKSTRQVLVSPDGPLHLLPFSTLIDKQNHYLMERFELTYLASGRDLLRLAEPLVPPRNQAIVIGGPDFEHAQPVQMANNGERSVETTRSEELGSLSMTPLLGARSEATAIAALFPGAKLLTGEGASENALKALRGPALLHLATHGFFLKNVTTAGLTLLGSGAENPLLRSGLALAGFNERSSGTEDGVLTALEAASLDLEGTQLTVLSACDTGLGEVSNSEGVYGLRRAFAIAGARSQVFSLWKVNDQATAVLMKRYYGQLLLGGGRGEGLRQVQLELLRDKDHAHPYWWAGFVEAGDWRPLERLR